MSISSYHMVNIANKRPTNRTAVAVGTIDVGEMVFEHLQAGTMPKGDPCVLSEIAGINGAKQAAALLPLCHPLNLEQVNVTLYLDAQSYSVHVSCLVSAFAKTGVEMEALAGVNSALLCFYDLSKVIQPVLYLKDSYLALKVGGKSGVWLSERLPKWLDLSNVLPEETDYSPLKVAALTVSTRVSTKASVDLSGPMIADILSLSNVKVIHSQVCSDDKEKIYEKIMQMVQDPKINLIITTGGTGPTPDDVTPDVVCSFSHRQVPGIAELMRSSGAFYTQYSWLSRAVAVIVESTLIVTFPGNPDAIRQGLPVVLPLLLASVELMARK